MARNPTAHGPGAVASKLKALSRQAGLAPERREQLRVTAASLVATERLGSAEDNDNEAQREAAAAKERATNALLDRRGGLGADGASEGGDGNRLFQDPRAKEAP